MATELRIKRRVTGATGAPAALKSGELAYNMVDGRFYAGFGDDGSGNATSIKPFASDDHAVNLPVGGSNGQILGWSAGKPVWTAAPEGALYTAGTGLTLNGTEFSINDAVIVTHVDLNAALATLATDSEVATLLAGKAEINHTHSAADITSGVFDIARIPVLPSQTVVVSSGAIAALTSPQQTSIAKGTVVTTTDGRRWVYNTGTKTLEASYVELADITPDWTVVANKPSFATVATSGAYSDLSGRPTLATVATTGAYNDLSGRPTIGTMAAQNSNAVTITGGTINNVVLDGGTF